jgi:probable LLM family oxidoreductase
MTAMQLGLYSFGSLGRDPDTGDVVTTAQAMRNLLEAIRLADDVGLDYFGIGEHRTREMPASAAATILSAASSATSRIQLGSAVTVLSTEDPVRLYQQFATLDALSGGRAEITAGRGSSTESFTLFGADLADYDRLFAERLDLLLRIDQAERVTWSGATRPALTDGLVVPRPDSGHVPIWLGTGGSPASSVRAASLGLPIAYGIIGGRPERFAELAELYRQTWKQTGRPADRARIAVGGLGFVAETSDLARQTFFEGWHTSMSVPRRARGFPPPTRERFEFETHGGALFVGAPERVAQRIIELHDALGHMRHLLQMDIGPISQRDLLTSIELLGTKVKPLVDSELGAEPGDLRNSICRTTA